MTANHRKGGAVGVNAFHLRSSPAIANPHHFGPRTAMYLAGLGPRESFVFNGDRRLHRYAIGRDRLGINVGFYIDYDEGWATRHVVFGELTSSEIHVWCAAHKCPRCQAALALGNAQAVHYRRRFCRAEVSQ